MKKVLLEDIKRISSLMYGRKEIISEKFSKKIKDYFYDNGFIKGVFPGSGGYTNEFFDIIVSDKLKSLTIDDFEFELQQENPQYDLDAYHMPTFFGTNKARALIVAKDPESTRDNLDVQRNPSSWETYVMLSKVDFSENSLNDVTNNFSNLKISNNCDTANLKKVFCLTGTLTKEQVVKTRDYLEKTNWAGLDNSFKQDSPTNPLSIPNSDEIT